MIKSKSFKVDFKEKFPVNLIKGFKEEFNSEFLVKFISELFFLKREVEVCKPKLLEIMLSLKLFFKSEF